ncbi:hypothetical protein [Streptomyces sp. Isolate_45]|uniref:hypothetical protein n=1 Tax=Streptomyces sp. Isolate_45 TaxID=2950111 RepID=UPI002481F88C|nr:hypothetical protein [Streptomyces sp. Isolate_45]MDA5280016.1 hypothetical protein [Streptomyces sp. Isolate_45]
MARATRTLAIGAATIFLLAGCQADKENEPPVDEERNFRLIKLESTPVSGDPLTDTKGPVHVLAELKFGQDRIIAYVNNNSCGVLSESESQTDTLHLVSKWPTRWEGSNPYPAGPYNTVSGAGAPETWASMLCSENAMVIDYVSTERATPDQIRGQVSVTQVSEHPATLRITVAEPTLRQKIEDKAQQSPQPRPQAVSDK